MKFILNSLINTLPTQDNLKLWGKTFSNKCHLSKNRDSTLHCLNGCKLSLNQGRYTWRHDNIIKYIVDNIDRTQYTVYSDIYEHTTSNGGTIPPSMTVTSLKPDIVIVDNVNKKASILELTVPFESNIEKRHEEKTNKYAHFSTDITSYDVTVTAFEIGSRGTITSDNLKRLRNIHAFLNKSINRNIFIQNMKKLSPYHPIIFSLQGRIILGKILIISHYLNNQINII